MKGDNNKNTIFRLRMAASRLALALVLATPVIGASSAMSVAQAQVVQRIVVEGNRRVEREAVLAYLQVRPGERFDAGKIDASLKALFQTGLFSDVQILRRAHEGGSPQHRRCQRQHQCQPAGGQAQTRNLVLVVVALHERRLSARTYTPAAPNRRPILPHTIRPCFKAFSWLLQLRPAEFYGFALQCIKRATPPPGPLHRWNRCMMSLKVATSISASTSASPMRNPNSCALSLKGFPRMASMA